MIRFAPLPLGETVSLQHGAASLEVAPACGARLLAFDVDGEPVLRRVVASNRSSPPPYSSAGFPLLPYSGPLFSGGFHFRGVFHRLGRNLIDEPDATHGHAWLMPWRIAEQSRSALHLALDYVPSPGNFPFAWSACIEYRLSSRTLHIDIALTNASDHDMPAGMGFHPYFPRRSGTTLTFTHGNVWPADSAGAVRVTASPIPDLHFNDGRELTEFSADRCFDDWDGTARLHYSSGRTTTLSASRTFGKLQLYAPWDDPFVCVEPVTNANDGFNRAFWEVPSHGVVILARGATLAGSLQISTDDRDV
jgi:aldose 1-epimerase